MRRLTILALIAASIATPAIAADTGCITKSQLAWAPAVARAFDVIDTGHTGCITPMQIQAYRAALKQDRAGQTGRLRVILAHGG